MWCHTTGKYISNLPNKVLDQCPKLANKAYIKGKSMKLFWCVYYLSFSLYCKYRGFTMDFWCLLRVFVKSKWCGYTYRLITNIFLYKFYINFLYWVNNILYPYFVFQPILVLKQLGKTKPPCIMRRKIMQLHHWKLCWD